MEMVTRILGACDADCGVTKLDISKENANIETPISLLTLIN